MVARTETIAASASGSLKGYEDMGVKQVEFYAATDERLCPDCMGLHESVYPLNESSGIIPVHVNCRCTWLSVIPGEEVALEKPMGEIIRDKEDSILAETNRTGDESAAAFSSDGKVILDKMGEATSVRFEESEITKLKGAIFTHSHPSNNSFSADDLAFAANAKLKEMRIVSTRYKYSLYPQKTWGDYHKLYYSHREIRRELHPKYYKLVMVDYKMSPAEASWEHTHETMTILAKRFKLIYKREAR